MKAFSIDYTFENVEYHAIIDARDVVSARNKIAKKHKCKSARSIRLVNVDVIGYF